MKNPDQTKKNIIKASSKLFNTKGYSGSSISAIMDATGLKKGGIYNHFSGKEEIALQAFDYAFKKVSRMIYKETMKSDNPIIRIQNMFEAFRKHVTDPPVEGGCPVMNTSIECDDTNQRLQEKVREAMSQWQNFVTNLIEDAQKTGKICLGSSSAEMTDFIISSLEGGIMMSKLFKDKRYMDTVISHLSLILFEK